MSDLATFLVVLVWWGMTIAAVGALILIAVVCWYEWVERMVKRRMREDAEVAELDALWDIST